MNPQRQSLLHGLIVNFELCSADDALLRTKKMVGFMDRPSKAN